MRLLSYFSLVGKLFFSLVYYLCLFFLEKIFANKFFLITNSLLTGLALLLLLVIFQTPDFIPPPEPKILPINKTDQVKTVKLSQQEAHLLLQANLIPSIEENVSQKYYLNLANLNLIASDKQKADYFLKIARYINPNTSFIE
ncbi:MAG: hypothetical protein ACOZAK_04600 [Patescibacteria group bacterium]